MKYRTRIHYTATDKALMWDRWQKGDSLQTIAQLFGCNHSSVARIFFISGGIRPFGGRVNYRAAEADQAAWDRALRPKTCKLVV
jgi:hypothetical protein